MTLAKQRPRGLTRLLAKLPLLLYRVGLGWLLGKLFVQITHRGRKSGRIRQTVLEVLRYDRRTHEVVVVSGWQGRTDWYRNIQREPALWVTIGRISYRPAQELLSPEETYAVVREVLRRRPREAKALGAVLGIDFTAPDAEAQVTRLFRGVRFWPAYLSRQDDK
ncbi:deazaflavin-dependent oxidoreductase (nitroreductase family) [Thermosporothrix hazakensis]|uniref:Deazaflavin-dependent oxidoreductase (Nitroreductase family) n=2 Tax=Thermosporothrix TaxID=768650 RepID=A0A326U5X2_THEHA|nr:nitroreductase family deazaflavin-dependent oxidoreductase [Thermosporothrix hazakensis]PZW29351.1 deazaflavin-dependent oxidoreductase (nitroreductase family) [Thermosporothrix hazakensis]